MIDNIILKAVSKLQMILDFYQFLNNIYSDREASSASKSAAKHVIDIIDHGIQQIVYTIDKLVGSQSHKIPNVAIAIEVIARYLHKLHTFYSDPKSDAEMRFTTYNQARIIEEAIEKLCIKLDNMDKPTMN